VLTNRNEWTAGEKLRRELERNPPLAAVVDVFHGARELFEIAPDAEGLELIPLDPVHGVPNRCRLKLFKPREKSERLCAFFYKRSNLAWSRDRFSYGGVEFRPEQLQAVEARSWVEWLASGFDPDRRPERLRRAFLYDIPD